MKHCYRCGKEHDYAIVLCPHCRTLKQKYDKVYAKRPDVAQRRKEKKKQLRELDPERIRKQKRASDEKYKILKTLSPNDHRLFDRLVETLFSKENQ